MRNPINKSHVKGGVTGAVMAAALVIAIPQVQRHEGVWLTARVDTIGTGKPVTWCYGETEGGAKVGQRFTPQECKNLLAKKLVRYADSAAACITVPVSPKIFASFIDFNYNVGERAFCKSTIVKKLNAGDYAGACEGFRPWTQAGGQFRKGLLNRRIDEIALCREGIADLDAAPVLVPAPAPAIVADPAPTPIKSPDHVLLRTPVREAKNVDPYSCFGGGRYLAMALGKVCK